jgi:hypothetical protein
MGISEKDILTIAGLERMTDSTRSVPGLVLRPTGGFVLWVDLFCG